MVHRFQAGEIIVLEHDPFLLQLLDLPGDVLHLEAHRRVLGLGPLGLGEQGDYAATPAGELEFPVLFEP